MPIAERQIGDVTIVDSLESSPRPRKRNTERESEQRVFSGQQKVLINVKD